MTIPHTSLILILRDNENQQPQPQPQQTYQSNLPKQSKKETPRTLKKIKSREDFLKYQWSWIV